jgi:hypothetical protein
VVHQRSPQALVLGYIRRFSFRDKILAETVSKSSRSEVLDYLTDECGIEDDKARNATPLTVIKGVVLTTPYGVYNFQKDEWHDSVHVIRVKREKEKPK